MKKKGFTLVELLVSMASASIILAALASSVYFVTKLSTEVTSDSSNNVKIRMLRDYIIANKIVNDNDLIIANNDKLYYNDILVVDNIDIKEITIVNSDLEGLYKCNIKYLQSDKEELLSFSYEG